MWQNRQVRQIPLGGICFNLCFANPFSDEHKVNILTVPQFVGEFDH